jgi:transcriptional regulator with XRE-family HTH domain
VARTAKHSRGRPRKRETKLSRWIDASGMSRDDVAHELGVGRTYLDKLCRGQHLPGLEVAFRIEQLTGGAIAASDWIGAKLHHD